MVCAMTRAGLDKQPHAVASMFDGVAGRYDVTNTLMTLGMDRRWRRQARRALGTAPGERVLDLAAGTAVSTVEIGRDGAFCVAADFSLGMLRAGAYRNVPSVAADALRLPFADDTFDAVTISFGLRNIADTAAALGEMARVTRPGGRLLVAETSTPTSPRLRRYLEYLMGALPAIARRVSSNPDAYGYFVESLRAWPDQPELATIIQEAGWTDVAWRDLSGGIVALHRATKPGGR
jgi:demethylmenaquinone methyltransferase/2-methoxy-6-polyprenyl-1,4-benzoquinol methylase